MKHLLTYGLLIIAVTVTCDELEEAIEESVLPSQRTFHMGFTAFPYNLSAAAQYETCDSVAQHVDLLLTHLDHSVS